IMFASVKAGELATDADYVRVITRGLKGTNMLALPLEPKEVEAVTQYVKSLSAKWTDPSAKAGTPITAAADPWTDEAAAVAKGKELVKAHCASCHATADNEGTGSDSSYGFLKAPKLDKGLALKAGDAPADIYRVIAAGLGGTAMT
ncbi:c-type cytochrome, partial [Bradyrhizobium sp. NBAIM08]|uniref:c-type cytochrome n=1 Tax=Bradyrhizobium sp. NBAIM08 TaxID=2793815 RepID=UPI001CD6868E